jgi:hypothetical protein
VSGKTRGRWLAIDPGETTGWSLWEGHELVDAGQDPLVLFLDEVAYGAALMETGNDSSSRFWDPRKPLTKLVVEEFRLYPWVVNEGGLDFDELRTSRGIGALEFIARHAGLEFVFQSATVKEPALNAGAKELFLHPLYPNRHANDSIMHGWYHIVTTMLGRRIDLPDASIVAIDPSAFATPEED